MTQLEPGLAPRPLALTYVTSDGSTTYEVDRAVPGSSRERALLRALLGLALKNLDQAENPMLSIMGSQLLAMPCEATT